ncbi:MAG: DNA-processing protein DprA [Candidatus Hydrogenedentes bacterium]|nr:DNA-processing protein DprA [Candidatus Hydrogenedentota bacterium]
MSGEIRTILALLLTPGVGNVTTNRLLAAALRLGKSLEDLRSKSPRALAELFPAEQAALAHALTRAGDCSASAEELLQKTRTTGARTLVITESQYPKSVRAALGFGAPPLLFISGNTDLLSASGMAIVGTRRPTPRGLRLATECAKAAASRSITVVSGGAMGVDTRAHVTALSREGKTVVVLPQGLLTYRPPSFLQTALEEQRAALVSEFAPDVPWQTHAAVTRNATVSALSKLVCVIEPKRTGGSIRTGRCALAAGKPVLVQGARARDPAATLLIREGADPLLDGPDGFHAERLVKLWEEAPDTTSPDQGWLFE